MIDSRGRAIGAEFGVVLEPHRTIGWTDQFPFSSPSTCSSYLDIVAFEIELQ